MYEYDHVQYFIGFFAIVLIICIAVSALYIVSLWKLFNKAGEKGWKAIVPIYNYWIMAKLAVPENPELYFVLLFVPLANIFASFYLTFKFAKAYGASDALCILTLFFSIVTFPILAFNRQYQYIYPFNGPGNYPGGPNDGYYGPGNYPGN